VYIIDEVQKMIDQRLFKIMKMLIILTLCFATVIFVAFLFSFSGVNAADLGVGVNIVYRMSLSFFPFVGVFLFFITCIWYHYVRLAKLVCEQHIYDVAELDRKVYARAVSTTATPRTAKDLQFLIKKGYLKGFNLVDNTHLVLQEGFVKPLFKCPHCGFEYDRERYAICAQCGAKN
jgi:hypothetical protein